MKLKLNTGKASSPDGNPPGERAAGLPPTPASTGGGFKLSLKHSQPPTPATEHPGSNVKRPLTNPKPRKPAITGSGKKRPADDDTLSSVPKRVAGPTRKISLKIGTPAAEKIEQAGSGGPKLSLVNKRKEVKPKLRAVNFKRPPPPRMPGLGYDSEDSDVETDPAIQQAFILRMQPGEDCDYLRDAINNGRMGLPASEGGADASLRFVDPAFRRALVTVRGHMYAAVLVDLPCIVETMKSWDKKGWWKVADMSQMLLVLGPCTSDEEARNYALPREVDKETLQYPHGLTPPMHWVRKRRFRKRLSHKTVANIDEEVERLLKEDEVADSTSWEMTDPFQQARAAAGAEGYDDYAEEDAPMETIEDEQQEAEYFEDEDDAADLEGNLQAMFDEEDQATSAATPIAGNMLSDSPGPLVDQAASFAAMENALMIEPESAVGTPAEVTQTEDEGDEESSSDEDDEDEADSPDVMDEDAVARAAERNQQLEEVADLEREIAAQKAKVAGLSNMLLKQRAQQQLRTLEEDLRRKKEVFGMDDEADGDAEEAA